MLRIRFKPEERDLIDRAGARADQPVSVWCRETLVASAALLLAGDQEQSAPATESDRAASALQAATRVIIPFENGGIEVTLRFVNIT